jgi:hypothetical protein
LFHRAASSWEQSKHFTIKNYYSRWKKRKPLLSQQGPSLWDFSVP